MRFTREEYLDLMTFNGGPRPMFVELFGPLVGLEDEWAKQGATQDEISLPAFDWDYVETVPCGGDTGPWGTEPPEIIEETGEYTIQRDALGRRTKLYHSKATIPLPLDYPVETMDDWLQVKPHFLFREDRIDWDQVDGAKNRQAAGALVVAQMPGGFDMARELMGADRACLCYYTDPELMHDLLDTLLDTTLRVLDRVSDRVVIDQLSVHEDLAGKGGPMIGPRQVEEFIAPYYRQVWDLLSSRGTRLFDMDTDGNVEVVLDLFLDCGLNSMHPFEPAAGMDIVALRKKYGNRLAMRGGIDKHVLRQSKEDVRRELEYKMQPLVRDSGTAFGLDHRIPNGTPIENYRYYVELGREILGIPALDGKRRGWRRMAF